MIKVTLTFDNGNDSVTYEGKFAVVGIIKDDGDEEVITVNVLGKTTAFAASLIGCEIASRLIEPFDTLKEVRANGCVRT